MQALKKCLRIEVLTPDIIFFDSSYDGFHKGFASHRNDNETMIMVAIIVWTQAVP